MKDRDINVKISDFLLNVRAVAVIVNDNKILFQKRIGDSFWALPGGMVKIGEKSKDTIIRELNEELGIGKFEVLNCNSVSEYFFSFNDDLIHQYIFSYIVEVGLDEWIIGKNEEFFGIEEDTNLVFRWINLNNIENEPVKPEFLKEPLSLMYNNLGIIIGMVYTLLPFMSLPLNSAVSMINQRELEAASDLGASKFKIFKNIILPQTYSALFNVSLMV